MCSLRWTPEQYEDFLSRSRQLDQIGESHGLESKKPKYRNQKVTIDGVTFDSKKEAARFHQLKLLETAGKLSNLERQKVFELAPSVTLAGRKKPALRYYADFVYNDETGTLVVEDVKSEITRKDKAYRIKVHLMKHVHNIEIREI